MTPQEQDMLDGLIGRVQNAQVTSKDADADRRIHDTLGSDPDALYVLCQTVLLQGYALEQAQKQLAALQEQANRGQAPSHEPTFLEKIFGRSEPEAAPSYPAAPAGAPGYGAPVYSSQPPMPGQAQYGQPGYTRPGYGQPTAVYPPVYPQGTGYGTPYAPYGGGGGFLQGALQTAAGVALGEMAFETVEGLFRGVGHAAGYGSDRAMGFGDVGGVASGTDDPQGGFFSREQAENGVNDTLSPDIEDRRGEASGFVNDGSSGVSAFADKSAIDDSYDAAGGGADDWNTGDGGSDGNDDDGGSFGDGGDFSDSNS